MIANFVLASAPGEVELTLVSIVKRSCHWAFLPSSDLIVRYQNSPYRALKEFKMRLGSLALSLCNWKSKNSLLYAIVVTGAKRLSPTVTLTCVVLE